MALLEIERCECGGHSGRLLHAEPDPACEACAAAGKACDQLICTECGGAAVIAA